MHIIGYISLAVNVINVAILLLLLSVYAKNYRDIRSKYNLGLMIFSVIFLVENIVIIHLGLFAWPLLLSEAVIVHMIIIDIIELVGFLMLLYITWK
jgi:hypothetical protein